METCDGGKWVPYFALGLFAGIRRRSRTARSRSSSPEAVDESRRLSAQFYGLLVKAGLAKKRSKKNTGRGHSVKRTVSELTFHSLRHNTTSWLKRAGVPASVVRDIISHESDIVSRDDTHVDEETKRAAISRLPNVLTAEGASAHRPHAA